MARKEGQSNGIGGGDGVGTISRAHASLVAILALALGALVVWAIPAMARDLKEWHREFYGTRKPAESCKNSQPVR